MPSDSLIDGSQPRNLSTYNPNWELPFDAAAFRTVATGLSPNVTTSYPYVYDSIQWKASVNLAPDDQFSQCAIVSITGGGFIGLAVRLSATGTGYWGGYSADSGLINLGRIVTFGSGRATVQFTNVGYTPNPGDVMKLSVSGQVSPHIVLSFNGIPQLTHDDTVNNHLSGQYGLMVTGATTGSIISAWQGGSLAGSDHPITIVSGSYVVSGTDVVTRIGAKTKLRYTR